MFVLAEFEFTVHHMEKSQYVKIQLDDHIEFIDNDRCFPYKQFREGCHSQSVSLCVLITLIKIIPSKHVIKR